MSPKKIDHLLSSYLGFLATANKALFPMNDSRRDVTVGLQNRFVSDANYSTDVLNKTYENRDLTKRDYLYYGTADKAVEYEQNEVMAGYISGMNSAIRAMPEDKQRNGRGYLLQKLNAWNYSSTAGQNDIIKKLKGDKVPDDCLITSIPKSTLEWTETAKNKYGKTIKGSDGKAVKYKCTYQMTPQEYHEYITEYLKMVDKYRTYAGKNASDSDAYIDTLSATKTEVNKVMNEKYRSKYLPKATKVKKQ
jgi:hypothetical protein